MTDSAIDPTLVQPGMSVIGSDGQPIGEVSTVRENRVMVSRRAPDPTIAVPWQFVQYVSGNQVVLTVASSRISQMGWDSP